MPGQINKQAFKESVYQLVRSIPRGRVMTYGQIAACLGYPRAAQYVGWTLHWADFESVPYQRVVNRFGGLASGYPRGGREGHRFDLETLEGVTVDKDFTINLDKYLWQPPVSKLPKTDIDSVAQTAPFTVRHS